MFITSSFNYLIEHIFFDLPDAMMLRAFEYVEDKQPLKRANLREKLTFFIFDCLFEI